MHGPRQTDTLMSALCRAKSAAMKIHEVVLRDGYCRFEAARADSTQDIASFFGKVVPSRTGNAPIDTLRPIEESEAHTRSLSKLHGRGEFPLHTDGSTFDIPPRFVLLRYMGAGDSDRATNVSKVLSAMADGSCRMDLVSDIWLVNGGRDKFYVSILGRSEKSGIDFLRYDLGCMRPVEVYGTRSRTALAGLIQKAPSALIYWRINDCLLIDNWSVLHGRSGSKSLLDEERVLERAYIMDEEA